MAIVALRDIKEGGELTHSYVDIAKISPVQNDRLWNIHGFEFLCWRCKGGCCVSFPKEFISTLDLPLNDWILTVINPYSSMMDNVTVPSIISVNIDKIIRSANFSPTGMDLRKSFARAVIASDKKQEEANLHLQTENI